MERLTEVYIDDNGGEFCALVGCKEICEYGWTEDESGCRCDKVGEMQIRLAAYEDIGTPEQCSAGISLMQKQEQGLVVEEDKINQWVNVKDKLPDEDGTAVLVASATGFVGEAQYYNGAWHSGRSGVMDSVPGKVTHWMELPELPGE